MTAAQLVVGILRKMRLTLPAFRALEYYRARKAPEIPRVAADGLPLPARLLMVQVAGHADHRLFLEGGRQAAATISATLGRQGVDLGALDEILDFGIGCGRVARHWRDLDRPRIIGCDYNERLVQWCNDNLPFVDAYTNELVPPLPFDDARFDFIYGISVFTHLSEDLQHLWIAELRRVLKPGGLLLFTTAGTEFRHRLAKFDDDQLDAFDRGTMVVTDQRLRGTNRCNAYHPPGWIEQELLDGFALAEFAPAGMASSGGQDVYLVRKNTPSGQRRAMIR